ECVVRGADAGLDRLDQRHVGPSPGPNDFLPLVDLVLASFGHNQFGGTLAPDLPSVWIFPIDSALVLARDISYETAGLELTDQRNPGFPVLEPQARIGDRLIFRRHGFRRHGALPAADVSAVTSSRRNEIIKQAGRRRRHVANVRLFRDW